MGTALFHVQAASIVFDLSKGHKGFTMSSFIAFGNVGLVLGPLLFVPLIDTFGLKGTPLIAIPGLFATGLLLFFGPKVTERAGNSKNLKDVVSSLKGNFAELNKLILVVAIRTLFYTGLVTMLPIYFKLQKIAPNIISFILSLLLFSGAVGGLIGGFVSDKYGRKLVIASSLAIATPLLGFCYVESGWKYFYLALAGVASMASSSVTVVLTQELIPENKATASGLSLGFAMGIGGLLVGLIGKYAVLFGVGQAIILLSWLPLLGSLFAITLRNKLQVDAVTSTISPK